MNAIKTKRHIELCNEYINYIRNNLLNAIRKIKVNKRLNTLLISLWSAFEVVACKLSANVDVERASIKLLDLMNYVSRVVNKRIYLQDLRYQ